MTSTDEEGAHETPLATRVRNLLEATLRGLVDCEASTTKAHRRNRPKRSRPFSTISSPSGTLIETAR